MAGRPPLDLHEKVCELLEHAEELPQDNLGPLRNDEERSNACRNLRNDVDKRISKEPVYQSVLDRHNLTHNTGYLTVSDARRLTLMVKREVPSGKVLSPGKANLRYVKRFLDETAKRSIERVGERLAVVLTERHQDDSTLFDLLEKANEVSVLFGSSLTVNGVAGMF